MGSGLDARRGFQAAGLRGPPPRAAAASGHPMIHALCRPLERFHKAAAQFASPEGAKSHQVLGSSMLSRKRPLEDADDDGDDAASTTKAELAANAQLTFVC